MYHQTEAAATTGPTFHAPARSSGRMQHMALALELMQLSMRCRISHPKLALVLEAAADTAIAEQRATGTQPSLVAGLTLRGRASDLARTLETPTADELAAQIVAGLRETESAARLAQRVRDEQDARALTGDTANDIAAQQRAEEQVA